MKNIDTPHFLYLFNGFGSIMLFSPHALHDIVVVASSRRKSSKKKHVATINLFNAIVRSATNNSFESSSSTSEDVGMHPFKTGLSWGQDWRTAMRAAWLEEKKAMDKKKSAWLTKQEERSTGARANGYNNMQQMKRRNIIFR